MPHVVVAVVLTNPMLRLLPVCWQSLVEVARAPEADVVVADVSKTDVVDPRVSSIRCCSFPGFRNRH